MRHFVLFLSVIFLMCNCSDGNRSLVQELNARIDSLEKSNVSQKKDLDEMNHFVNVLSDGLDSIAKHEEILLSNNKGKEGVYVDRKQLKSNLEMFENMLVRQKQRISSLIDSLKSKGANIQKLNNLVIHLNQQLDEKNATIQSLKADLEKKDVSIKQLSSKVADLAETNTRLNAKVERQVKAIVAQDEVINEGYVKIATKRELADLGMITTGFLKKTNVNYNSLPKEKFLKVDIRHFTEMSIESKNPKILTQMPTASYKLVKTGKGTTILQIIDPTAFWSVSNYLIIQTN